MKFNIIILTFILLAQFTFTGKPVYSQKNNTEAALYNISSGAVISGIGAVINKKKDEKFLPVLFKGIAKGILGGGLVYSSKQLVYNFAKSGNYSYLWSSKLVNAAGNSIVENGASNIGAFDNWAITFGFNRIEFETKGKFSVKYKIMPFALYGFMYSATQSKFDFNKTVKSGTPVFTTDYINAGNRTNVTYNGVAITTSTIILNNLTNKEESLTLAHEIIHTYQYLEFFRLDKFFVKAGENWFNNENKSVKLYKKWIRTDWTFYIKNEIYRLEDLNANCYFDNFFEQEANFYSHKSSICE